MITKKDLEDLLQTTMEKGLQFAFDGFVDDDLSGDDYSFTLGEYHGRQEMLIELLKKFE